MPLHTHPPSPTQGSGERGQSLGKPRMGMQPHEYGGGSQEAPQPPPAEPGPWPLPLPLPQVASRHGMDPVNLCFLSFPLPAPCWSCEGAGRRGAGIARPRGMRNSPSSTLVLPGLSQQAHQCLASGQGLAFPQVPGGSWPWTSALTADPLPIPRIGWAAGRKHQV